VGLATGRMPEALNGAGIVRGRATAGVLRGYLSDGDRTMIDASRQDVAARLAQIDRQLSWIDADSAAVRERVVPAFNKARDAFASYSRFVEEQLLKASEVSLTGAAMFDGAAPTFDAFVALSDTAYDVLLEALESRASNQAMTRNLTVATVAVVVLLSLALSCLITIAVTRPMARAIHVFGAIAAGHYDNEISYSGSDEVAKVLGALDDMQVKLRQQIETERAQAAENVRLRNALDR